MKFIAYPLIAILCLLVSCSDGSDRKKDSQTKSDSEKMIEKANNYISVLNSIEHSPDKEVRFEQLLTSHRQTWTDLLTASKGDSIYANQDLTEAKPIIYKAILKHLDIYASVFALKKTDPANLSGASIIILITTYDLELPYCTTAEKLRENAITLTTAAVKLYTKPYLDKVEMTAAQAAIMWINRAAQRKDEIDAGNLYHSKFLK